MPPGTPYRRFRGPGDEPPATWTEYELTRAKRDRDACARHLIDLMREYGGATLGDSKALYRQRCELDILPGSDFRRVTVIGAEQSYCGSPAAMSAGY